MGISHNLHQLRQMERHTAEVSEMVNTLSFDYDLFCSLMMREHRTLQQNFTRLCLWWIKTCASDSYGQSVDGRNEASHTVCKALVSAASAAGISCKLPYV